MRVGILLRQIPTPVLIILLGVATGIFTLIFAAILIFPTYAVSLKNWWGIFGTIGRSLARISERSQKIVGRLIGLSGVVVCGAVCINCVLSTIHHFSLDQPMVYTEDSRRIKEAKHNLDLMNSGVDSVLMVELTQHLTKYVRGYSYFFDHLEMEITVTHPNGRSMTLTRLDIDPKLPLPQMAEEVRKKAVAELGEIDTVMASTPASTVELPPEPSPSPPPTPEGPDSSDLLLKTAGEKWNEGDIATAIVLAEKARDNRIRKYGPDHEKVKEVEAMLKAARQAQAQSAAE